MRLFLLGSSVLAVTLALVHASGDVGAQSQTPFPLEVVRIAPGEFMMGCSNGDTACNDDERPSHRVRITKAFEIGKYEVTQAQYQSVMGTNPSTIRGDNRPVETVSKDEALEFLNRLNARNDGYRYRLPTEAEWEYVARAGSTASSTSPLNDVAWHAGNSDDETHPVGTKKPNAWGLHDMQGNVREWVSDWYSSNYYRNSPVDDPIGPTMPERPGPPGGRGGRGPGGGGRGPGGPGPGGPGGFGGPDFGPPPLIAPCPPAPGDRVEDLKQEVDDLRRQVACLERQIADLSALLQGRGGRGGGPPGPPPGGPPQGLGVMRGGAWDNLEPYVRVSARYNYYGTSLRVSDVGFRIVRESVAR